MKHRQEISKSNWTEWPTRPDPLRLKVPVDKLPKLSNRV